LDQQFSSFHHLSFSRQTISPGKTSRTPNLEVLRYLIRPRPNSEILPLGHLRYEPLTALPMRRYPAAMGTR
jgi:hypothetical protein